MVRSIPVGGPFAASYPCPSSGGSALHCTTSGCSVPLVRRLALPPLPLPSPIRTLHGNFRVPRLWAVRAVDPPPLGCDSCGSLRAGCGLLGGSFRLALLRDMALVAATPLAVAK